MNFLNGLFGLAQVALSTYVFLKYGRQSVWRVGLCFLYLCAIYHGLVEVLISLGAESAYRDLIYEKYVTQWIGALTVALYTYTAVYVVLARRWMPRLRPSASELTAPAARSSRVVIFSVAVICVILIRFQSGTGALLGGLIDQFLLISLITSGALLNYYTSGRLFFVVIALQGAALLTTTDSRGTMLVLIVANIIACNFLGVRLRKKTIVLIAVFGGIYYLAVTSARTLLGREMIAQASFFERASAIGATPLGEGVRATVAINELAGRIDGNSFAALILESRAESGTENIGLIPLISLVRLATPSALSPSKHLQGSLEDEAIIVEHYGLPKDIDYLPTILGTLYAYYGIPSLIVGAILIAIMTAALDSWIEKRRDTKRIWLLVSAAVCFLLIEQGLRIFFVLLRGSIVIFIILVAIEKLHPRTRSHHIR